MRRRQSGRRAAARRLGALAAVTAVTAVAACVEITAGPGGVASIRLFDVPPSIVIGDVLRDSLGNELRLRGEAFDEDDQPVADAPFRFTYVPLTRDTSVRDDTALVVDSVTGAVRATGPRFVAQQGRVGLRLGGRLQVLDTLDIVPRPTRLDRAAADGDSARVIYYDCREAVTAPLTSITLDSTAADSARVPRRSRFGNFTSLATLLLGDSAGRDSTPVRRFLVRYELLAPVAVPTVQIPPPRAATRAAIAIIDGSSDTQIGFDTTETSGLAQPRLRIFPAGITGTGLADTAVTVRATARWRGTTGPAVDTVLFVVRFRPLVRSQLGTPITCPRGS
jgi:hypothetical protein